MMLTAPAVTRSSMELMLDAVRHRDEQQCNTPPVLPARPTLRARRPSSKRSPPLSVGLARSLPFCLEEKENRAPQEGREAVLRRDIYADKRVADMEQMASELQPVLPTVLEPMNEKVSTTVDASNQTLQGILSVQKHFRGLQARLHYQELKGGVITLQSFVRGERTRHQFIFLIKRSRTVVIIQKYVRRWIARKTFHDHRKKVILLQSVVRGWLARRHFSAMKNLEMKQYNQDFKIEHPQLHNSVLVDLPMQVLRAEEALRQKEKENFALRRQLQQYSLRWSEYEAKMKSMEDMWQKQMTSLQMSLAAARKSLAADIMSPPGKLVASPTDHNYESEDYLSAGTRTPEGTPAKQPCGSSDRTSDYKFTAVNILLKEFEQQKDIFEDVAGFLVEVKSGPKDTIFNPDEDLLKLKSRFAAWKKDFKVRLRETKSELRKMSNLEAKKTSKRWWRKKSTTKA